MTLHKQITTKIQQSQSTQNLKPKQNMQTDLCKQKKKPYNTSKTKKTKRKKLPFLKSKYYCSCKLHNVTTTSTLHIEGGGGGGGRKVPSPSKWGKIR
jgi:hypothetical protein